MIDKKLNIEILKTPPTQTISLLISTSLLEKLDAYIAEKNNEIEEPSSLELDVYQRLKDKVEKHEITMKEATKQINAFVRQKRKKASRRTVIETLISEHL